MARIVSLYKQLPIHEELAVVIDNCDTAHIDLLCGLLFSAYK
jgi:hypothetical protein